MHECETCFSEYTGGVFCCFSMCYDCFELYHPRIDYCSHWIVEKYQAFIEFNLMKKSRKEMKTQKREYKLLHREKKKGKIRDLKEQMSV